MTSELRVEKRPRDLRLDFFRGLAMLVIFIAHVPNNSWNGFIPARFGFSNATEMFVFGSGFASALAFGSVFVRHGWLMGCARILLRCWQVYWAHIGLFLTISVGLLSLHGLWPAGRVLDYQGLDPFITHPAQALTAMMTLRWQADYLDVLPMYLVILLLIPLLMGARAVHPSLPFMVSSVLYAATWTGTLDLTGNPWTGRMWYFNPFAWQFIFFVGFAFGARWLNPVRLGDRIVLVASSNYLAIAMVLSFWGFTQEFPFLLTIHDWLLPPESQQMYLHPLRIIHFLALAYVVLSLIEPWKGGIGKGWSAHVVKVGQQSLAAFLSSLVLARLCGIVLDQTDRSVPIVAVANMMGLMLVVLAARTAGWFKQNPWSKVAAPPVPEPVDIRTRIKA